MATTDASEVGPVRLIDRLPVPRGALPIWVGLGVNGVASYAFLVLAARQLDEAAYDAISVLWAATFILGPGLFLPLEQELARALTTRQVAGIPGGAIVSRAATLALGLFVVLASIAVIAVLGGSGDRLFEAHGELSWVLIASVGAYGMLFLVRGVLAGSQSFGRYGLCVGGEGGFRLIATAIIVALVVPTPVAFGVAFVAGPVIAAVVAGWRHPTFGSGGTGGDWRELGDDLGTLLVASVALTFVFNVGPVAYQLLDRGPRDLPPGALFSARVVAGIPLFLFQAVQSSILPELTRLASTDDRRELRQSVRRTCGLVVVAGLVALGGAALWGSWAIRIAFDQQVGRLDITLLTLSTVVFILASLFGVCLIALGGHRAVMYSWLAGAIGIGAVLLPPLGLGPALRVELALLAGPAVALAMMSSVFRTMSQDRR